MEIFRGAPMTTLAWKIYSKRNKTDTCFVLKQGASLAHLATSGLLLRSFVLAPDSGINVASKLIQAGSNRPTYTNQVPIIGSLRTVILAKSFRSDAKKFWDYCVNLYFMFGILKKAAAGYADHTRYAVPKTGEDGLVNYLSLNEYIEDNSLVAPLRYVQLDYLFRIYFAFLAFILFVNMAHYAYYAHYTGIVRFAESFKRLQLQLVASISCKWRIHPVNQ